MLQLILNIYMYRSEKHKSASVRVAIFNALRLFSTANPKIHLKTPATVGQDRHHCFAKTLSNTYCADTEQC